VWYNRREHVCSPLASFDELGDQKCCHDCVAFVILRGPATPLQRVGTTLLWCSQHAPLLLLSKMGTPAVALLFASACVFLLSGGLVKMSQVHHHHEGQDEVGHHHEVSLSKFIFCFCDLIFRKSLKFHAGFPFTSLKNSSICGSYAQSKFWSNLIIASDHHIFSCYQGHHDLDLSPNKNHAVAISGRQS